MTDILGFQKLKLAAPQINASDGICDIVVVKIDGERGGINGKGI